MDDLLVGQVRQTLRMQISCQHVALIRCWKDSIVYTSTLRSKQGDVRPRKGTVVVATCSAGLAFKSYVKGRHRREQLCSQACSSQQTRTHLGCAQIPGAITCSLHPADPYPLAPINQIRLHTSSSQCPQL